MALLWDSQLCALCGNRRLELCGCLLSILIRLQTLTCPSVPLVSEIRLPVPPVCEGSAMLRHPSPVWGIWKI